MTKKKDNMAGYELVPFEEEINGRMYLNLGATEASADSFRYGRLIKAGKMKEAKKMENTRLFRKKK